MEQKKVNRRSFFQKTAALAGAAGAALSLEERQLLAFQQGQGGPPQGGPPQGGPPQGGPPQGGPPQGGPPFGGRGPGRGQPAVPDIPGPIPTIKIGGLEVTRLIAGHNLVVGQAHDGGSGLIYVSSLLSAYFTEDKVLETFAMYEKHGINTSGARMAANMAGYIKKYRAQGGKLNWMAGISSDRDLPMAADLECKLGYVHGNTSDALIGQPDGTDQIAKLLDGIRKAKMVGGICCHSLDVAIACDKAGVKPDFYMKTFNPHNFMMTGAGVPAAPRGSLFDQAEKDGAEKSAKLVRDFMASVKVPWIGFKTLAAGRVYPSDAFEWSFKHGCDALLVGMYDFQVANNANMIKKVLQGKDKIERTRPWLES